MHYSVFDIEIISRFLIEWIILLTNISLIKKLHSLYEYDVSLNQIELLSHH